MIEFFEDLAGPTLDLPPFFGGVDQPRWKRQRSILWTTKSSTTPKPAPRTTPNKPVRPVAPRRKRVIEVWTVPPIRRRRRHP